MSPRTTGLCLLVASAGAIVVLLGPLGTVGNLAGLAAIILGTVIVAPAARGAKGGWWNVLASGAALSVVGAVMSPINEGVGGLLALLGGAAVLIGAALGFPSGRAEPGRGA